MCSPCHPCLGICVLVAGRHPTADDTRKTIVPSACFASSQTRMEVGGKKEPWKHSNMHCAQEAQDCVMAQRDLLEGTENISPSDWGSCLSSLKKHSA